MRSSINAVKVNFIFPTTVKEVIIVSTDGDNAQKSRKFSFVVTYNRMHK
jgi:hypothetical protein